METELRELLREKGEEIRIHRQVPRGMLRRARRRRMTSGVLAGTIAVGLIGVGMAGIRAALPERHVGFAGPDQAATWRGIWPQETREEAEIAQSRADDGDDGLTHQLDANVFVQTFARDGLHWTDITFKRIDEDTGRGSGPLEIAVRGCPFDDSGEPQLASYEPPRPANCPMQVEVTIERLLRGGPSGIWLVTEVAADGEPPNVHRSPLPPEDETNGPELNVDPFAPEGVGRLADAFIEARKESRSVEEYLSLEAARAYEESEGGLSLFGYASAARSLTIWEVTENADGWQVVVGFEGSGPRFPDGEVIREILLVGPGRNLSGEASEWVIVGAERSE